MNKSNKRIAMLMLTMVFLLISVNMRVLAEDADAFTKEEGKDTYTIPENSYIMVKQADWYFLWTPEAAGEKEAELLQEVQSRDKSLEQSSYNGTYSNFDTPISFPDKNNSGTYTVSQDGSGSYILEVRNQQGELDAGKASHVGYGVYAYPLSENIDAPAHETQSFPADPEGNMPNPLNDEGNTNTESVTAESVVTTETTSQSEPGTPLKQRSYAQVPRTGDISSVLRIMSVLSAVGLFVCNNKRKDQP